MAQVLVLNGPNLNLLGTREPTLYGHDTLDSIKQSVVAQAAAAQVELDFFQSNAEHALIERIHRAREEGTEFIIINPAGFTHTSVALRDALLAVEIPFIELHLSNTFTREDFRKKSFFSDIALGLIQGFGAKGYELALDAAIHRMSLARTDAKS